MTATTTEKKSPPIKQGELRKLSAAPEVVIPVEGTAGPGSGTGGQLEQNMPTERCVKATCEMTMGQKTASGWIVDMFTPCVALPSRKALGKYVRVTNPANDMSTLSWVADVGPWNEMDDAYVFGASRPQAETPWSSSPVDAAFGRDTRGRRTNRAGIGLSEATWKRLGMAGPADVIWEFVS